MDATLSSALAMWGLVLAALAGIVALLTQARRAEHRRARLRSRPFPPAWRSLLRRRVPIAARLPVHLRRRLEGHVLVFLAEQPLIGCGGLVVTNEMRLVVAAQACLLLLGRERPDYFEGLRQVLLYPGLFVVDRTEAAPGGVVHDARRVLSGESWQQGQVILSWDDVLAGAADPGDGRNVVLHEFAHQLDQQTGAANGVPAMRSTSQAQRWAATWTEAYARLQARAAAGEAGVLDAYGASSEAECFAVATEAFFEQPAALEGEHPRLYAELVRYYAVDPARW